MVNPDLLKALVKHQTAKKREPTLLNESGWSVDQFYKANLERLVADRGFFGKGPKRIRKKKAKRFLAGIIRRNLAVAMTTPIRQRLDYSSIGRRLFSIEPLPAQLPF